MMLKRHLGLDADFCSRVFLQNFVKYNEKYLQDLPCKITEPIPLGEGAGVGWMKGADSMPVSEGSTLYDLVQIGIKHTHASVGTLVRLREELPLVDKYPVLLAIDEVRQLLFPS